jgi:hypothetical protein
MTTIKEALMTALVEVEESKIDWTRMAEDDDYDPPGIGCGDADAILAALPPGTALITDAERAVVEAAKAWHGRWRTYKDKGGSFLDYADAFDALDVAVDALLEGER